MSRLLHVGASPRGAASESLRIADVFLDTYRRARPDAEIETWDLWDGSLPAFGPPAAAAKMTVFGGGTPQGEQASAWQAARAAFERIDAADRLLFSVPMWNAGIPYVLKQLIDVISQPGMVFGVDPERGYSHLGFGLSGGRASACPLGGRAGHSGCSPAPGPDIALDPVESRVDSKGVTIRVNRPTGRPQFAMATPR